jgi:hypothetical protein
MNLTYVLLNRSAWCTVARGIMAGGSKRAASTSQQPAAKKVQKEAGLTANGSQSPAEKKKSAAANGKSNGEVAAKKNKTETDWDGLDFSSEAKGKNGHP